MSAEWRKGKQEPNSVQHGRDELVRGWQRRAGPRGQVGKVEDGCVGKDGARNTRTHAYVYVSTYLERKQAGKQESTILSIAQGSQAEESLPNAHAARI